MLAVEESFAGRTRTRARARQKHTQTRPALTDAVVAIVARPRRADERQRRKERALAVNVGPHPQRRRADGGELDELAFPV